MRPAVAFCLALSFLSAGCAYVPPLGHQYNAGDLARLVPGRTNRAEADRLLRSPDRLQATDRILICEQSRHVGYGALVSLGGGVAGKLVTQRYRILLLFDSTGVLQRREVVEAYREHGRVPGLDTARVALPAPQKSLWVRQSWIEPPGNFTHLAAASSGVLAAVDSHAELWLWRDTKSWTLENAKVRHRGPIRSVALSPDARFVYCLSRGLVCAELPRPEALADEPGILEPLWSDRDARVMALSPDGARVATVDGHRVLAVLDTRDGRRVDRPSRASRDPIVALAWSPDGRRLASLARRGAGYVLSLCAADSAGAEPVRVGGGTMSRPGVPTLAFSHDGRWVAINLATHVELWSVSDSSGAHARAALEDAFLLPYAPDSPEGGPGTLAVSFSPGSQWLAASNGRALACALDGSRRRWDLSAQKGSGACVRDLAIDPADGRLVVSTARGLFVWDSPDASSAAPLR